MAVCGEDEFGNLFADMHVKDVHALRGLGSLHWSLEDELETSTDTASKDEALEHLSVISIDGCDANVATAQVELHASPIQCAFKKDNQAKCGNISKNGTDIALRSNGVETDSDDDLRIVLNPLQKSVNEGSADESEDGEDFVVLTGNEVASGQEWKEDSFMSTEDRAQAKVVGGEERPGISADRPVQNQKTSKVHPRMCYGGQAFRRHYRYVRENGVGRAGANFPGNARTANCRSSYTNLPRIGGVGGFTNSHRVAGGNGATRGFSSGPDYILPFNKTVFDIDIDAFKEKPWRLSNVDASDYFNFDLDESSWKNYCKKLAQFCLEVTTTSKISVYESGRLGQPTAHDTQAGGIVGRGPSADVQGQEFRESDAIFLINVKEDNGPQTCSEGHQADAGDACKVLNSGGLNMNADSEKKAEKERPSVKRRSRTNQKRSTAVLREFSANVLHESGDLPVVSRVKTPGPATPLGRLPNRGKKDILVCGKSRSSSSLNDGLQAGQEDCNSGILHKRKGNLQLAGSSKATWRGQSTNAASCKSIREDDSTRRTDLKRRSAHAIAAQMLKKRKLDSNQANHGCRYASLLIKKLSRVRTSIAIPEPQVGAETIQQGKHLSIKPPQVGAETIQQGDHLSMNTMFGVPIGKLFNGSSGKLDTQVAERQEKPIIGLDNKRSKRKCEANSTQVKDVLPAIPCDSVKEKSRQKLKVKKSKKGHKDKKGMKSKGKVHLPGCPKSKKGLTNNNLIQEIGNMSMISLMSKDNKLYWEKVGSLSQRNIEDVNAEKMSTSYQCHEIKQRIERRSALVDKIDGHSVTVRGEKERKERNNPLHRRILNSDQSDHGGTGGNDKVLENNAMHSWNAFEVIRGKKNNVKPLLMREMKLASSKERVLANLTRKAHANDGKQVLMEDRMTFDERRKQFEDKKRPLIHEQPYLESEYKGRELSNSAHAHGKRCKKRHSKKLHKSSCKNSNKLIIPSIDREEKQSNTAFFKHKNYGAATFVSGKMTMIGNSLDYSGKGRGAASEMHHTQPLSTKLDVINGGKRMWKVEKPFKQTMWHYQETKSFWAFSV